MPRRHPHPGRPCHGRAAHAHAREAQTGPLRHWAVDTLAVTLYFTVVGGLNERLVAGMPWAQVADTRLAAVPVLVVTGALYGAWRDLWIAATGFARRTHRARAVIDTLVCLSFRGPAYALILWLGGADAGQFARGMAGGLVVILLSGRPCGMVIDLARRSAGVPPRQAPATRAPNAALAPKVYRAQSGGV